MSMDYIKSLYYEFLSYFVVRKPVYGVKGQCKKCGKCCKEIRIKLRNKKHFKIIQFLFPLYRQFYIIKVDDKENLVLGCKHLNDNGTCNIYKFRPLVCRNYPMNPPSFFSETIDGCGYEIVKKEFKDYL